jgi:hypothetical protein
LRVFSNSGVRLICMKLFNPIRPATGIGLVLTAAFVPVLITGCANNTNSALSSKPVPYPLDTCVVSGEKFGGDMGDPVVFIYSNSVVNQEIKFCCPDCKPKFLKDPDKYMQIISHAEVAQKSNDVKN